MHSTADKELLQDRYHIIHPLSPYLTSRQILNKYLLNGWMVDLRSRHKFCKQEQVLTVIIISQKRNLGLRALSDLIEVKLLAWCCQKEVISRTSSSRTRDWYVKGECQSTEIVPDIRTLQHGSIRDRAHKIRTQVSRLEKRGWLSPSSIFCLRFKEPGSNLKAMVYQHMCNPSITRLLGRDFWYQGDS